MRKVWLIVLLFVSLSSCKVYTVDRTPRVSYPYWTTYKFIHPYHDVYYWLELNRDYNRKRGIPESYNYGRRGGVRKNVPSKETRPAKPSEHKSGQVRGRSNISRSQQPLKRSSNGGSRTSKTGVKKRTDSN